MFDKLETLRMARSLTAHAAQRQAVIARNIANADTPDYVARDLRPFEQSYLDSSPFELRSTDNRHYRTSSHGDSLNQITLDRTGAAPNGNTVSIEDEMMRMAETRRQHEIGLSVYRASLTLLRGALGKRG